MFSNLFLDIGINSIDINLVNICNSIHLFIQNACSDTYSIGSAVAVLCCTFVWSYECFEMILGRRMADVMRILRPIILGFFCSSGVWSGFLEGVSMPGKLLEERTKEIAAKEDAKVADLEKKIFFKINDLTDILKEKQVEAEMAKDATKEQDKSFKQVIGDAVDSMIDVVKNIGSKFADMLVTNIALALDVIIRFIGGIIWQVSYAGIIITKEVFLALLAMFGPIAFALSIADPWRDAWANWLMKYLSVSLWGFIAYLMVAAADQIQIYSLQVDLEVLTNGSSDPNKMISAGWGALGSTCNIVISYLIGAYLLRFVPEIASSLLPAGAAASGLTSMVRGFQTRTAAPVTSGASAVAKKVL